MKLDQLTVEIRPRRAWEAVDLGARMTQRWWRQLTLILVVLTLPIWLLLGFISQQYWYYKLLLFWLAVPLFERPLLYFLSKAVFNDVLSVGQTLKAAPRLFLQQAVLSVTWRRLSPSRSMDAPVVVLENLKGSQRTSRISTLHREDASPAAWLSFIGHFCVYAIALTLFTIILQFISHFFDTPWWQFMDSSEVFPFFSRWAGTMLFHLLYVGFVLVTPFYVAAGFALYLNRRIKLEAWDVEIAFRRMAQKREHARRSIHKSVLVSFLLLVTGLVPLGTPTSALAEGRLEKINQAKVEIEKILAGEDFNRIEIKEAWELPIQFDLSPTLDADISSLEKLLNTLVGGLANFGELVLWVIVLCLVFYLVFRYRHWFAEIVQAKSPDKKGKPQTLFGLAITAESLPDDVGASALKFWQEGKHREALALLYRASLSQLVGRGLELQDGDTELECLKATTHYAELLKLEDATLEYFKRLTAYWRKLAYGHIVPDFSDAHALCSRWALVWQVSATKQAEN